MTVPVAGKVETVAPGLRCVLAPNPGPMTHWGTNTYILGEGEVAVIDPGPADEAHLAALLAATTGERISHILVTHAHRDHSPLARRLSEISGAPVLAFGPPEAGRSPTMQRLAATGQLQGGEGVDTDFRPDGTLGEGDRVEGAGWSAEVLHTPGHFAGHLAFRIEAGVISGDHVMDWASSLVSPPDGDISDFMATSERLRDLNLPRLFPGHGRSIDDPSGRLDWLIAHRRARETAILGTLASRPQSVAEITTAVYADVPPEMHPAAARNVFAHLVDLVERKRATAQPILSPEAGFSLA